ncbi:MAG: trypsin-like serine protease [Candidatus Binatia bacterium]
MTRFERAGSLAITALTIALAGAGAPASAGPRIVNGLDTHGFPTTGALLYSGGSTITANNASTQCSGTLIGCQTFLTAAHCVEEDTTASHYWVYLQNGGIHQVSSITYHPAYNGDSGRDVAIVKLTSQVTGIDPTTVNSTHDLDAMGIGFEGTIAGFGRTGGGSDYGIKRYGAVVTADCDTGATGGEGNDVLVCWDYDSSVGPAGEDSNTCNGDSGGPLFMNFAGTVELVGVTSAGITTNCLPTDHSWDASVYYNATWIGAQLGADSTGACGGIAAVGHPDVTTFHNSGALSLLQPSDSFTVNLTGSASVVRFTLNGTDNGSFNPNFFVKEGPGASAADFDCKADGATVFGACEFANPSAGTWSVFVERASGSGGYQVTTTLFDGDPPVCGNNIVEFGEECDGTSDAACAALCTACSCPAPVCGNNLVEAGEECDGSQDSACPGECTSCSCPAACSTGPLYGVKIVSDERRLDYKAWLFDGVGAYAGLDPREDDFTLSIEDGVGLIDLAIPAAHPGWVKADPLRGRYMWKGDGLLGGLRRVKLTYRTTSAGAFWILIVKGREVPGGATVNVGNELDFELGFDGTCHLETW